MSSRSSNDLPTRVADIDWDSWQPVDRGTILFVMRQDRVLLIHKKRGLGAGKINGPGGRLAAGESPIDGAVREVEEEIGITPTRVGESGQLQFQFVDGYSIHVWVFSAAGFRGEPSESEEARPFWASIERLPYDRMWADDRIWFPLMLQRRPFLGRFVFDEDRMLDYSLIEPPPLPDPPAKP